MTFGLGLGLLVMLIAVGAAALGIIVAIIAIIFSIAAVAVVSLYAGFGLVFATPFAGLFYIGLGLTLIGLFFVCLPLVYWLIRLIIQGIANFAKFLYSKVQARRDK